MNSRLRMNALPNFFRLEIDEISIIRQPDNVVTGGKAWIQQDLK